jgi:hypothetical protein
VAESQKKINKVLALCLSQHSPLFLLRVGCIEQVRPVVHPRERPHLAALQPARGVAHHDDVNGKYARIGGRKTKLCEAVCDAQFHVRMSRRLHRPATCQPRRSVIFCQSVCKSKVGVLARSHSITSRPNLRAPTLPHASLILGRLPQVCAMPACGQEMHKTYVLPTCGQAERTRHILKILVHAWPARRTRTTRKCGQHNRHCHALGRAGWVPLLNIARVCQWIVVWWPAQEIHSDDVRVFARVWHGPHNKIVSTTDTAT